MIRWACLASFVPLVTMGVACGEGKVRVDDMASGPGRDAGADAGPATGGGDAGDAGGTDSGFDFAVEPEVREAHETLQRAECQMIFQCCSAQEIEARFGFDGDEAACSTSLGLFPLDVELALISSSVRAGRMAFDPAMAQLCIESYLARGCEAWVESDPMSSGLAGCEEAITPLVEAGGNCVYDRECTSGYCQSAEGPESMGTCVVRPGPGEACEGLPCAPGHYCDPFRSICVEQLRDNTSCLRREECRSGHCLTTPSGDMVCGPAPAICLGE